ncbi:MAG TPA: oligoendopeptidase F [Candidatus Paceibacterota bacterium]|nr:oligoendopeptidase F [Verrucomicrobiota bacterium]HRZ44765.1 oligoendopeptidase F [Candidatus Paceibacterota bacterium]
MNPRSMTRRHAPSASAMRCLAGGLLAIMLPSLTAAAPPERTAMDARFQWDLTPMYADADAWGAHYRQLEALVSAWAGRKGSAGQSAASLLETLRLRDQLNIQIEKLSAFAMMRRDEDMRQAAPQALYQRAQTLAVQFEESSAWFQPELLAIPEERIRSWLREPGLEIYSHYFDDLWRTRKHVLTPREEELLAMAGKATEAAPDAFGLLSNTELRWRTVKNPAGEDQLITPPAFLQAMYSPDRRYRRDAFAALHDSYLDARRTLAATLAGAMHRDWFYAKARRYPTSLDRALDAENLPASVYHGLVRTVNEHRHLLHRFVALKQKALRLDDEVHFYDLYVDLVRGPERQYAFEEARQMVIEGIAPFGPEYAGVIRRAFDSQWIDVFENQGKRGGAYNMGTYLSPPYVLLNYKGTFNDVSTLAHELGHAAQSWFARENQPPAYAGYPMFTAEVASTAAEIVFKQSILDRTAAPGARAFLIHQMLEDMRQTVFRQTQFAEFDLAAHTMAERGDPMTADALMKVGREIYARYYGPDFVMDPGLEVECLRVPHYYRSYYVYRYANSYCAAAAIARRILRQEPGARDAWMQFLKTGNSRYAIDMLRDAGADMTTPRPIEEAMGLFKQWLDELDRLLADEALAPANTEGQAAENQR